MSTDAPADSAPANGLHAPDKEGCLVRMLPITTPGCASCLTSVFLIITVAVVWLVFFLDPLHVPWRHAVGWPRILAIVALTVGLRLPAVERTGRVSA